MTSQVARALLHLQAQHVDYERPGGRLPENVQHFIYHRGTLRVAEDDSVPQMIVVALRVKHAHLKALCNKLLHHGRCEGRLTDPRRASY
jgi:hypothetical protein